ncbi:hypothetical protein [Kitasatospora sp. HPMI-4]|uniref:hypothetical protein n=1 Tax=Kitasatospora sp. HPMI-4 TaxID=3448443 RepID=UPI003F1DEB59
MLSNHVLQNRRLSYTARGLLGDLLSRPDGWREDCRQMADSSPQGRAAVRKALRELIEAGHYRIEKVRMPDGTIRSQAHVYEVPQLPAVPSVTRPVSGKAATGRADSPLVKDRYQVPTHPADLTEQAERAEQAGEAADRPEGREECGDPDQHHEPAARAAPAAPAAPADPVQQPPAAPVPDEQIRQAAATLFRVIRPEPRLRLGEAEAVELAPLVAQWLDRGSTPGDLAQALLPGLPAIVHCPAGVVRDRLKRKMPPTPGSAPDPGLPLAARYSECAECHDPVPSPGICRACAGLGTPTVAVGGGALVAAAGAARVRAAMRAVRGGPASGSASGSNSRWSVAVPA